MLSVAVCYAEARFAQSHYSGLSYRRDLMYAQRINLTTRSSGADSDSNRIAAGLSFAVDGFTDVSWS